MINKRDEMLSHPLMSLNKEKENKKLSSALRSNHRCIIVTAQYSYHRNKTKLKYEGQNYTLKISAMLHHI